MLSHCLVLYERTGRPTKEFSIYDLGGDITFDAFYQRVMALSFPGETGVEIDSAVFKYNIEGLHESRWVHFDDTAGLGYALDSNQSRGYAFVSALLVKKGVVPSPSALVPAAGAAAIVSPRPLKKSAKPAASKVATAKKKPTSIKRKPAAAVGGVKISVCDRILATLWYLHSKNVNSSPRKMIGLLCGFKNVLSAGFAGALTQLQREQGLIEYPEKGAVRLTELGKRAAESLPAVPDMPKTNADVQVRIKSWLKEKEVVMFECLLDGQAKTQKEIAAVAGYTNMLSQGLTNGLGKLETLELIGKDPKTKLFWLKEDVVFPFGRQRV